MAKISTLQKVKVLDRIYDEQMNRMNRNISKNKYRGLSSDELQKTAKQYGRKTFAVLGKKHDLLKK